MCPYGYPFWLNQTLKNYLIMLEQLAIKILDFNTVWLLKCFVAEFVDFGAFLGCHLAYVAISLMKYVSASMVLILHSPLQVIVLCERYAHHFQQFKCPLRRGNQTLRGVWQISLDYGKSNK